MVYSFFKADYFNIDLQNLELLFMRNVEYLHNANRLEKITFLEWLRIKIIEREQRIIAEVIEIKKEDLKYFDNFNEYD